MKRAFTLIELLVVIAIVAILAAILFPVFAQAKAAAKKTASLSNAKQTGTSVVLYTTDAEDTYPRAWGTYDGLERPLSVAAYPFDWNPARDEAYREFARGSWANLTEPYRKSGNLLRNGDAPDVNLTGDDFSRAVRAIGRVGYDFNGLLHVYSASSVAAPSSLPVVTQLSGKRNLMGYAASMPALNCPNSGACRYVPSSPTCDADARNGEWSEIPMPIGGTAAYSRWVHGNGMVFAMADTSAKFRRVGAAVRATGSRARVLTDFRTDPFFSYDAQGRPNGQWMDRNFCHVLLFMPDFDFQDFGTPSPWDREGL